MDSDTHTAARAALATLRDFADRATPEEVAALDPAIARLDPAKAVSNYPDLRRDYNADFTPDATYKATMPDLQNGPSSLIVGARKRIAQVGISNFRLPIRYRRPSGGDRELETSVTGSVSLDAESKGINMSRIMRSFYRHAEERFSTQVMEAVLDDYIADLGSPDARLQMAFSYPVRRPSLRSGMSGWQYYDIALEMTEEAGQRSEIIHLDFVYSSTCPCSLELSEHARQSRGQLATPHSQRSIARISVKAVPGETLWFEDLITLARNAVPTETQVMVKREDEQAFAELNAANTIFVEDAVRAFAGALDGDPRIGDYRVMASHRESLHSHDAIALLTEGDTFPVTGLDPQTFANLVA